jgi:hypothetical protein
MECLKLLENLMLQSVERTVAPDVVEATLKYVLDTGEMLRTHTVTRGRKSTEVGPARRIPVVLQSVMGVSAQII